MKKLSKKQESAAKQELLESTEKETSEKQNTDDQVNTTGRYGIQNVDMRESVFRERLLEENTGLVIKQIKDAIRSSYRIEVSVLGVTRFDMGNRQKYGLDIMFSESVHGLVLFEDAFGQEVAPKRHFDESTEKGRIDRAHFEERVLMKLVGAKIEVVPKQVLDMDGTYTVLASRKAALESERNQFYVGRNKKAKERMLVNGTVVFVRPHAALINVHGIEISVPYSVLTDRYTRNLNELYRSGDKVQAVIVRLLDENGELNPQFDFISAELAACRARAASIRPGTRAFATVSKIRKMGTGASQNYRIVVWLDGYDCAAMVSRIDTKIFLNNLKAGDRVRVEVTEYNKETGKLRAWIMSNYERVGF